MSRYSTVARIFMAIGVAVGCGSAAHAQLVNGSFETPSIIAGTETDRNDAFVGGAGSVTGWTTTEADHQIEIWSSGFEGALAYDGNQFVELNANAVGTLYQDVSGIGAGEDVGFQFAHRGRLGVDTMQLTITDLGPDGIFGTGDDTTLFSQQYSDDNTAWGFYTNAGLPAIITLGNTLQFAYDSISAAGGNPSIGNFLDDANFGVGVGAEATTPEPGSVALLGGFGAAGIGLLSRRRRTGKARAAKA